MLEIEQTPKYKQLAKQFHKANNRAPNDLDRMGLIDQIKADELARMGDQLDRVDGMLQQLLARHN